MGSERIDVSIQRVAVSCLWSVLLVLVWLGGSPSSTAWSFRMHPTAFTSSLLRGSRTHSPSTSVDQYYNSNREMSNTKTMMIRNPRGTWSYSRRKMVLFGRHKKVKSEEEMSAEAEVLAAKKPRGRPSKKDSDEEFMTPEDMSLLTIGEDYDPDIDELARLEEDFSKLQGEFGFDEFMEGEEEGSKQSERPFNGDDVMPIASTKFKPRGKKGVVLPTPEVNMVELKAALEELDSTDGDVFEKILAMEAENNRNKRKGKSGDDKPKAKPGRKAAVHDEGLPAGVDIMGDLDEDPFLQPTKKSKRIIRTKGIAVPLANTDSEAMDAEDILGGDDLEMEEEEEDDDDDDVAPLADLVGGDEDDYDDDEMAGDAVRSNSYSEIGSIDESLLNLPYYLQKGKIMDTLPPLDVIAKEIVEMLPDYTFNVKLLFRASLIEDELVVTANPVMRDMLVKRLWIEKFGFADEAQSISEELESKDDEEMEFLDFIPKDNVTQIISIVQSTPTNNSAIGYVDYIYEYIRNATNNDPRIEYVYQILEDEDHSFLREDDADVFQMFTVGRNIYSLIDGAAMKEVWGCMMPHIIFGEDNLKAIAQQVIDAVEEEDMDAVVTTPRLSLVRFAGGSREMRTPFNTEKIDSEFSTVSVR